MKRNARLLLLLMAILLMLPISVVSSDAATSKIRQLVKDYENDGYRCTPIYNEGLTDEGFAAARATNVNYIFIKTALGQGSTECTNNAYASRLATGYASYKLKGVNLTEYHFFEPEWYTNLGTAIYGASGMKVTVCYAESSNGKTYTKLTRFVTDD